MRLIPPVISIYLMADTDTADLAEDAAGAGAGLLEIGIPNNEPQADGPPVETVGLETIVEGVHQSVDAGLTTDAVEHCAVRQRTKPGCGAQHLTVGQACVETADHRGP